MHFARKRLIIIFCKLEQFLCADSCSKFWKWCLSAISLISKQKMTSCLHRVLLNSWYPLMVDRRFHLWSLIGLNSFLETFYEDDILPFFLPVLNPLRPHINPNLCAWGHITLLKIWPGITEKGLFAALLTSPRINELSLLLHMVYF